MATSGTYAYNRTISQFLDRTLRLSGVVGENETPNAAQHAYALESLNLQQHQLQVNGIPLWKRGFHEFVPTVSSFVTNVVDSVTKTYRCVKGHTSSSDTEPGVGSLWKLNWVEVESATTTTVWATSTAYVTSIEFSVPDKFYDIIYATSVESSGNEVEIAIIPFSDYNTGINSKRTATSSSLPSSVSFDNDRSNMGYIYPQPSETFNSLIRIYGILKPEDADNVGENIDIPVRYINVLSYTVALDLAYQYQMEIESIEALKRQANYYLKEYRKSNREFTSTNIVKGLF